MKLTKSLRAAIARQFKDGSSTQYLAELYGFKVVQVEGVIREWMNQNQEQQNASRTDS